jgi:hypothetical protein
VDSVAFFVFDILGSVNVEEGEGECAVAFPKTVKIGKKTTKPFS